jgi:hypothetical protein
MPTDINAKAEIRAVSNGHILIASAHFLTFGDDSTDNSVFLTYEGETLAIAVNFMDDPNREPFMALNDEFANTGVLGLTFINFSAPDGVWNRTAYNIGKIAGRPLYLRAKILSAPRESNHREVVFSFYVEQSNDTSE